MRDRIHVLAGQEPHFNCMGFSRWTYNYEGRETGACLYKEKFPSSTNFIPL